MANARHRNDSTRFFRPAVAALTALRITRRTMMPGNGRDWFATRAKRADRGLHCLQPVFGTCHFHGR